MFLSLRAWVHLQQLNIAGLLIWSELETERTSISECHCHCLLRPSARACGPWRWLWPWGWDWLSVVAVVHLFGNHGETVFNPATLCIRAYFQVLRQLRLQNKTLGGLATSTSRCIGKCESPYRGCVALCCDNL